MSQAILGSNIKLTYSSKGTIACTRILVLESMYFLILLNEEFCKNIS